MNTNTGVMGFNVGDIVYLGTIKGIVKEAGWEGNIETYFTWNSPGLLKATIFKSIDSYEYIKVVFPMSGEMKFCKNTIQNLRAYIEPEF